MTKTTQILRNKNLSILCGEIVACQCYNPLHDSESEGKHEVGALVPFAETHEIETIYGLILVCEACFQGCH